MRPNPSAAVVGVRRVSPGREERSFNCRLWAGLPERAPLFGLVSSGA